MWLTLSASSKMAMMATLLKKDSKVIPVVVHLCGSVTLYRIAENLKED